MRENEVKPGTRCECQHYECDADSHGRNRGDRSNSQLCDSDAVRLVTVEWQPSRDESGRIGLGQRGDEAEIPLCTACAEWAAKVSK